MGAWFRWIREIWLGRRALGQTTERVTEDLDWAATRDLFTISGGRILVTQILGEITTAIGVFATSIQLIADPTDGTTSDLCALLLINGYIAGNVLGITGVHTDAMLPAPQAGSIEGQTFGVIVQEGAIRLLSNLVCDGAVKWTLKWIPFDTGAAVAAVYGA